MKLFKKKTEETAQSDVLDIEKLLTGDRKPVKPAKKPLPTQSMPTQKLLIVFGGAGLVLVFALITMIVAISVGRRTDPDFGFRDLFVPTKETATISTTPPSGTAIPTTTVRPTTEPETEPPKPTQEPFRLDHYEFDGFTYIVPNRWTALSLWEHYCTKPTLPIPKDTATRQQWILFFYNLLKSPDTWYNQALTSFYSEPGSINMESFLSDGVAGEGHYPEEYPESVWLKQMGFSEDQKVYRVPASDIHSLVTLYFGTGLANHRMKAYNYNPETDCYYYPVNSSELTVNVVGIVDYQIEGLTARVRYALFYNGKLVEAEVTLYRSNPNENYYRILSNRLLSEVFVESSLTEIPDITECVNYPHQYLLEGGYSGYAKWGDHSFYIDLPLLEPFSEGAEAINAEIKSIFQPIIDNVQSTAEASGSVPEKRISYEAGLSNDVLSIVITVEDDAVTPHYYVYNLDLTTGKRMDKDTMIQRYVNVSYPVFLLWAESTLSKWRGNTSTVGWVVRVEDARTAMSHELALDENGALVLINGEIADGQYSAKALFEWGNLRGDAEEEAYNWLLRFYCEEEQETVYKGQMLARSFFDNPALFLRCMPKMVFWFEDNARFLAENLLPEEVERVRTLCNQFLSENDTAEAAQALLDALEQYRTISEGNS